LPMVLAPCGLGRSLLARARLSSSRSLPAISTARCARVSSRASHAATGYVRRLA